MLRLKFATYNFITEQHLHDCLNSQSMCSGIRQKVNIPECTHCFKIVHLYFYLFQLSFSMCFSVSVCVCDGVHVTVREKQRFAMLFQSVVLPCQYQTSSTQNPVVQWWYKSYCQDRTRESFTVPESLAIQASELGATSHLECSDSSRTVRVVASAQGQSMTLAEHYKGRDIAIVNSTSSFLSFLWKTLSLERVSAAVCTQESELTVLCISCSPNKPLLSLSHNGVDATNTHNHNPRLSLLFMYDSLLLPSALSWKTTRLLSRYVSGTYHVKQSPADVIQSCSKRFRSEMVDCCYNSWVVKDHSVGWGVRATTNSKHQYLSTWKWDSAINCLTLQ